MNINKPPAEVAAIIKNACYNCHSHETKYPWYTNIVTISLWISKHIQNGRKKLNFSTWSTYSDQKADHKLEECVEKVSEKKMPLKSYTLAHSNVKLNAEQIKLLSEYFQSLRKK